MDASVNFRIVNSRKAVYLVGSIHDCVRHLAYSVLRNVAGLHTLQELLEKRNEITIEIRKQVDEQSFEWLNITKIRIIKIMNLKTKII